MRVFLPASLPMLRAWVAAGSVGPGPLTGYAVTPGLREFYAGADDEELEYAATARAARASLRLVPGTEPRRVVVAVDAADVTARDDLDEGAVQSGVLPWRAVAAALVDDEEAEVAVAQAIGVVDEADFGDPDAEFLVGATEEFELQWFAAQELADL